MSNSAESDSLEEIEREESEQEQETQRKKVTKVKKTAGKKSATNEGKRKKDPNAPKRVISAYLYFASETRNKVKEANPDMSFSDITRAVSEQWKTLTEDQKRPFVERQNADKARYQSEKEAYEAKLLQQNQ